MRLLWILGGLAAFIFLVDRLLLWLEWRGQIDYRRTYPGRFNAGQVGPAFLGIQSLLEPDKRYGVEEQTAVRTERENSGDETSPSQGEREGRPPRS